MRPAERRFGTVVRFAMLSVVGLLVTARAGRTDPQVSGADPPVPPIAAGQAAVPIAESLPGAASGASTRWSVAPYRLVIPDADSKTAMVTVLIRNDGDRALRWSTQVIRGHELVYRVRPAGPWWTIADVEALRTNFVVGGAGGMAIGALHQFASTSRGVLPPAEHALAPGFTERVTSGDSTPDAGTAADAGTGSAPASVGASARAALRASVLGLPNPSTAFARWYAVEPGGAAEFEPSEDVMELSTDGGVHWEQVFTLGGRTYVFDADCVDPSEFLEDDWLEEARGSSPVRFLEDILDEAARKDVGPGVRQPSGTVPPRASASVRLQLDRGTLGRADADAAVLVASADEPDAQLLIPVRWSVTNSGTASTTAGPALSRGEQTTARGVEAPRVAWIRQYPNPTTPRTTIAFSLPHRQFVRIQIMDVLGREIATLVNESREAGEHTVRWDASGVPSGVYLYRIISESLRRTSKLVVLPAR